MQIIPLALANGTACILAYGQTGTGKTYTMEALEYRIARDLFIAAKRIGEDLLQAERKATLDGESTEDAGKRDEEVGGGGVFEFNVTFLELLGKRVVDLLEPVEGLPLDEQGNPIRKEVPINEDKVCSSFYIVLIRRDLLLYVIRTETSNHALTHALLSRRINCVN